MSLGQFIEVAGGLIELIPASVYLCVSGAYLITRLTIAFCSDDPPPYTGRE